MQWCYLYLAVFGAFCLSLGASGDDCAPPKPGDKLPAPSQCCKKEHKIPEVIKKNAPKCKAKYPLPAGKADPEEAKSAVVCISECVFEESNLLTPDGKIDVPEVKKVLAATYPERNVSTGVDKCLPTLASKVDQKGDCRSGAFELEECLRRNCFLDCPKELWTASKECDDLKKKIEMCPNFPLIDMNQG